MDQSFSCPSPGRNFWESHEDIRRFPKESSRDYKEEGLFEYSMSLNLFVLFVHIGAINQPVQVECKWSLVLGKHPGFWDIFRLLKKFPHLANSTYCAILILLA